MNTIFKKTKKFLKQNILSLILPYLPWQFCDFGFSGRVIIEPTNVCNLRCPLCPTSKMKRQKGFLSLENFKKIIESIPGLKSISMNFSGEPLLNKNIFKMVKYAEQKGIRTLISTNTVFLDKFKNEALDSGLSSLIVCLDGATKETHERYRVGSDFESVKNNIKDFCQEKKKRKLKKPQVTLQFLVLKQNEGEIPKMIELAKELGVDNLDLKTLSLGSFVDSAKKLELTKEFLPSDKFSRYILRDGKLFIKSRPKLCQWLRQSVILWNGDVTLCCYDFEGALTIGNIFKDGGFKKIWKSKKYRQYRKKIMNKELNLCKNCNLTSEYAETVRFR